MIDRRNMEDVVAVVGDWHGNTRWAMHVLDVIAAWGVRRVYHVGDFGIWPGANGAVYLDNIGEKCAQHDITLWVTPGNHEDYDQIDDPDDANGGTRRQILRDGHSWELAVLPRGYTWNVRLKEGGSRKIVSLGGAPSIDFQMRKLGKDWWKEEMIRNTDLMRLEGRAEGADLMLAHDSPDGGTQKVQDIINTPPHLSMWSEAGLWYAREGRMMMNQAVDFVNPKMFVHGHYHVMGARYDEDQDRTYISLNCDGEVGNVVLLDLNTMEYQWV